MATISIVPETPVTAGLQKAVANCAALTALGMSAHFNIVGPDFFQLHSVFGAQYEASFETIDLLAERGRALNAFIDTDLGRLNQMEAMPSLTAPFTAQEAVAVLIAAHSKNVDDLKALATSAKSAGDTVTENMVLTLIEGEQKTLWMLKSYLK